LAEDLEDRHSQHHYSDSGVTRNTEDQLMLNIPINEIGTIIS